MGQIVKVYKDGVGYQVLNTNNIGDALEAGDNISINGNEISAVDTTYSAGTGLSLSGTTFSLNINYGADLSLSIDPSTFVLTAQLKDQNGSNIGSAQTIDLPLESVVVSGTYNAQTKEVELTLQSGSVIRFSVADLVSGLQEELIVGDGINIDANNEISVDTSVISTKEYVDDSIAEFISSGSTAPSNPTQGMLRYDTVNDVLKSYDGSNWNEVGNESADINTKTFHLSGTSDLTNAQAAYDWFSAGKNPIVMYNNRAYLLYAKNATQLIFQDIENSAYDQYSYTEYVGQKIIFTLSGNDVTAINYNSTSGWSGPILRTDVDYPTPYTPTYSGSPATKQYVDNNDTYIGTSAPTDNVVEGRLWYDTTNSVLKEYDGTNWNEVNTDTTYTAGTGINIDANNVISSTVTPGQTYTAGNGINISQNNEISADTSVVATQTDIANFFDKTSDDADDIDDTNSTNKFVTATDKNTWNGKQDELIAGTNIQIAADGKTISATDTKYSAGTGINIDSNNVISATATPGQTYTAGNGINISQNNEISADTSVVATKTDLDTKQDTLTAGENTSIENICESDMQGPCPSGFHVPTVGEWNGLINIMKNALSLQYGPDWMGYLHMPLAGQRDCESGDAEYQRQEGFYVTSIFDDATPSFSGAFFLLVRPGDTVYVEEYGLPVAIGLSIRGFKNEYITPTSSWTVVQGTLGSAGIFRDQSNGLISITDGTTGYTMMDKNLGATTVWNTGDTLSEANCGKYYQWGNNYGFPRSGSITTSSTQVDASGYGPGNYYSSSTFITTSTSPFDWSSVENKNLRGGVSQGTWCRLTISAEDTKYTAGNGININQSNEISVDTSVVATQTNLNNKVSKGTNQINGQLFSIEDIYGNSANFGPDYIRIDFDDGTDSGSAGFQRGSLGAMADNKMSSLTSDRLTLRNDSNLTQTIYAEGGISVIDSGYGNLESFEFAGGGNYQIARLKDVKTYTAGNGINISQNNEISADTTVLATKQDIADLGSFEVVASLPSVSTADTKTIYLLGPIGTGADKYEERIVTGTEGTLLAFDYPGGVDWQYMPNTITFNEPTTLTFVSKTGDGRIEFNLIDSEDYYQIAYCDAGEALLFPNGAEGWYYGANIDEGPAEYVDSSSCTFPAGTYQVEVYTSYQDPYDTIIFTTGTPKTWTKIGETSIDLSGYATTSALNSGLATKQNTLTASTGISINANDEISNTLPGPTIAATAPTGTEGALWYDTTNDVLMAHNGTAWKEAGTQMKVLSYGHSTWQDFLDAYNENAVVYCRASSNSNPGTGVQGRMAFMAFVSLNASTGVPTSVEFQYYRSRSDHNTAANQLDQVFVYKLENTSGGTWSVVERNTAAKAVAGTGINLAFGSGNMTISADTTTLATQTDLSSKQDTLVSGTNIKSINNESLLGTGNITIPIAEIGLSTATGNLLTSGAKIWVGDESDLPTTPNSNTVYLCAEQTSGTPRLPAAYQEVEYIESGTNGGTQYINFRMPYYDSEGSYSFEIDAGNVGNAEGILLIVKQRVGS